MPATITAEERAMIDAKVAAGKVTRCATGASAAEIEYVWCSKINRLVPRDKDKAMAIYRGSMQRHFTPKKREVPPHIAARRREVERLMIEGNSGAEIARILGIPETTLRGDIRAIDMSCTDQMEIARQKRRDNVARLFRQGMSRTAIAAELKLDRKTVNNDVKAITTGVAA